MIHHQAIILPRRRSSLRFDFINILPLLLELLDLVIPKFIRPGTRWTKIRVDRLPSPRCLDNQNGLAQKLLRINPKGEFRPDLPAILRRILT